MNRQNFKFSFAFSFILLVLFKILVSICGYKADFIDKE